MGDTSAAEAGKRGEGTDVVDDRVGDAGEDVVETVVVVDRRAGAAGRVSVERVARPGG